MAINGSIDHDDENETRDHVTVDTNRKAPTLKKQLTIERTYSVENGYTGKTRNIIGDAKFETLCRRETLKQLMPSEERISEFDEEDEENLAAVQNISESADKVNATFLVAARETMLGLMRLIKILEAEDCRLHFLETRIPRSSLRSDNIEMEYLFSCEVKPESLRHLMLALKTSNGLAGARLVGGRRASKELHWFPKHIKELDQCNHVLTKFEPELDMDHPGWKDQAYRARRKIIADISFNYKYGDVIPDVDYTKEDIETWNGVYQKVKDLLPGRASSVHRKYLEIMEKECGYGIGRLPQLEEVSNFLKRTSGFSLRPAAGLVTARDFLASLAFRVFQCTQYVRHPSSPHYSPEPDVLHELIGHCPMFADPTFAQFSQEIGLASLGATDGEIEKLATLYWFTVEFGLCKENGEIRAYGAGLLSSFGELLHSLSQKPAIEYRSFDCVSASMQEYDDQAYQDIYYVAESFEDAKQKLRHWVSTSLSRPFTVRYMPFTQTIEVLDTFASTNNLIQELKVQVNQLSGAFDQIESNTNGIMASCA